MANNPAKKSKRNQYALPIGGIFLALALVGLISVANFCVNLTNRIMDNTREKTMFEDYLLPVVMFDPVEFDSPEHADPVFLIQSSLWSALLSNTDKYSYDESAMLAVPASDLDVQAAKLYGSNVKLQHQTIDGFDFMYPYDEETRIYGVPVMGQTSQYTPDVTRIVKKGDIYTVTVGYIPPATLWEKTKGGKDYEPEPDKYMIFTMKKVKDAYNILSIHTQERWEKLQSSSAEDPLSSVQEPVSSVVETTGTGAQALN